MKILLTGYDGFIGVVLKTKLIDLRFDVVEFEGNICDPKFYEKMQDFDFTHCFHLAAKTFVPDSWDKPEEFIRTNTLGTQMVLKFCCVKKIPLTYVSAYIYGNPDELPITELTKVKPNNPYALSKYLAEKLCYYYSQKFNFNVSVIRPFNVYGPNQNKQFLIPEIINQALNNNFIQLKDLTPKRDYIYVEDLADAIIKCILVKKKYSVYNIASGKSISVKEVVEIVQKVTKTSKKIISEEKSRPNEIVDTLADIQLAKEELGWSPKYSFEDGILQIIQQYVRE